ncbi:MAG: hypothetical protein ACOCUS_03465 [Polyangiales bacterium]
MGRGIHKTVVALLAALLGGLMVVSGCGTGCKDGQVRDDGLPEEPDRPEPDLRLLVLTDLQGRLEPCGCTSRPLGGIDKLAAHVGKVREDGGPTGMVAAGGPGVRPCPGRSTASTLRP